MLLGHVEWKMSDFQFAVLRFLFRLALFSTLLVATISIVTTECAVANHYQTKTKIVIHPPKALQAPTWKPPKCPAFAIISNPWTLPPAWRSRPEAHPPNLSQWFLPRTILSAKRSCWALSVSVLSGLWWQVRTTTAAATAVVACDEFLLVLFSVSCKNLIYSIGGISLQPAPKYFRRETPLQKVDTASCSAPQFLREFRSFSKIAALHPKLLIQKNSIPWSIVCLDYSLHHNLSFAWIQKACDTDLWTVRQERIQQRIPATLTTTKSRPTWLIPDEASRHHFLGAETTYRCPTTAEVWRFIENNSWSFLP